MRAREYLRNRTSGISIGVHIRRGDFLQKHTAVKGYIPSQWDFIRKAIKHVKIRILRPNETSTVFLVGDAPDWTESGMKNLSESEMKNLSESYFVSRNSPEFDFTLLTMMDVVVISCSSSSFAWWAAYLNDRARTVLYNRDFAIKDSSLFKEVNSSDFFHPTWQAL